MNLLDQFWQTIVLLSIGTITIRGFFIFLSSKIKISKRVAEIFTFIPAAILPALLMPMVFFDNGEVGFLFGKERFLVLIIAIFVCVKTKNMLLTVGVGLLLLFTLKNI